MSMKKYLERAKENRFKRMYFHRGYKYGLQVGTVDGYNSGYENGYKMACMQMKDKTDAKRIMDVQEFED